MAPLGKNRLFRRSIIYQKLITGRPFALLLGGDRLSKRVCSVSEQFIPERRIGPLKSLIGNLFSGNPTYAIKDPIDYISFSLGNAYRVAVYENYDRSTDVKETVAVNT